MLRVVPTLATGPRHGLGHRLAWALVLSLLHSGLVRADGGRDYTGPAAVPAPPEPAARRGEPAERTERGSEPPTRTSATRARLLGTVLVYGERKPIAGARVLFTDGRDPADVDERGRFSVDLPPGVHAFVVRAPGYDELPGRIELRPGQALEVELRMSPAVRADPYRTVVVQRRQVAVSSTTLRDDEIRAAPGTGGDPMRIVASLPGTAPVAGFLPYVVVRGAAPGNTGYYLDGTRVPILFHVAIGPSVIHPRFIEAVDFYPSGAPVRLGRYVSGIIEGRTRAARRDRVHGELEIRLTDAGGLLDIPFNRPRIAGCREVDRRKCPRGEARGSLTLAGRYSYTAAILTAVQSTARIRYWDYQARLDHDIGRYADFTAFAYGSFDEVGEKPSTDPLTGERLNPDPFVRFHFHRLDLRVRQRLPRRATASYGVVFGIDQVGLTQIKTNEWRIAPRVDVEVPTERNVTFHFGIDQELQWFRLAEPLDRLEDVDVEDFGLLFSERFVSATGVYFDAAIANGRFEARPGVRVDLYGQWGKSPYAPSAQSVSYAVGVDPRLVLREQVGKRWTLKQTIGLYHQPPSFPIPVPGIESFGFDRGLQRNVQGALGYEFRFADDRLMLSQEAYVGWLDNLQDYELEQSASTGVSELEDAITSVRGWAYGLETMLKLDPSLRVFGWVAYTLARSERIYEVGGRAPAAWDQRHILNVVLGYRVGQKWQFGGRLHYHTGRPWTAPADGQTAMQALSTRRNNARLPPFFQLDLRAERFWRWPDWQLSVFLDVANATYSREVFACTTEDTGEEETLRRMLTAGIDPARGLTNCTAQGFRYVVPSLGVAARW